MTIIDELDKVQKVLCKQYSEKLYKIFVYFSEPKAKESKDTILLVIGQIIRDLEAMRECRRLIDEARDIHTELRN